MNRLLSLILALVASQAFGYDTAIKNRSVGGKIVFNNAATSNSAGFYEEGSQTITCTGAGSYSGTLKWVRVGKLVTILIPAVSNGTCANNSFSCASAVPSALRTGVNLDYATRVNDNGVGQSGSGLIQIDTTGGIGVYKTMGSGGAALNFTAGGTCGMSDLASASYTLN